MAHALDALGAPTTVLTVFTISLWLWYNVYAGDRRQALLAINNALLLEPDNSEAIVWKAKAKASRPPIKSVAWQFLVVVIIIVEIIITVEMRVCLSMNLAIMITMIRGLGKLLQCDLVLYRFKSILRLWIFAAHKYSRHSTICGLSVIMAWLKTCSVMHWWLQISHARQLPRD